MEYLLKISFNKTNSTYYSKALKLAKRFSGFSEDININSITLNKEELNEKSNDLRKLIDIISNWKSTQIFLDDKEIVGSNIYSLIRIIECGNNRTQAINLNNYCFLENMGKEGWHCKFLTKINKYSPISWNHYSYRKHIEIFWFDFGRFDNENVYMIDKDKLKEALRIDIENNSLDICPYFDRNIVFELADKLPDKIDLNENKDWVANIEDVENGFSVERKYVGILPKSIMEQKEHGGAFVVHIPSSIDDDAGEETETSSRRNIPDVSFDDIGGLEKTIEEIREIIELPVKQPELFKYLGIIPHKGILLYGPPGCGKTLIAKAIASEIKAHFISIKGPELFSKYIGQSEENLRKVFEEARDYEPSIIFFDEIDAIAQTRSAEESIRYSSQFVNQLLTLMDGVEDYGNIRIIASTNRKELLDEAVLRPGRFDRHIKIEKPTKAGCRAIFEIYTKKMPIANINIEKYAEKLYGKTGADIAFIVKEGAYNCIRRNVNVKKVIEEDRKIDFYGFVVTEEDFDKGLETLKQNAIERTS